MQEDNADKLGTDKFEVSWHGTARPEHQEWQGKVYTKEQLESVCGLGSVTGLLGANCRHTYFPFIEGVSERIYTDEQLRAMNERENEPKYYNGKPYTSYEATQRQRYLETSMRAQRQKIKLLEEAGADEQDITLAKCKYRRLSQKYTAFSKQMGLPQERDRIYADGLGKTGGKINGSPVTKSENFNKKRNTSKPHSNLSLEKANSINYVGKIDIEKFKNVVDDITTDEVIITDERIHHVDDHHKGDFLKIQPYLNQIISYPDLILEDRKNPKTALLLKYIEEKNMRVYLVLRLHTSDDQPGFKNSILSAWIIDEKRWESYKKCRKILYEREKT